MGEMGEHIHTHRFLPFGHIVEQEAVVLALLEHLILLILMDRLIVQEEYNPIIVVMEPLHTLVEMEQC
jgi:hypothetical protein